MSTTNYLGIDLHKEFAYWYLTDNNGGLLWEGKVSTDKEATRKQMDKFSKEIVSPESITSAIESVDSYGYYADLLTSLGVGEVKMANPTDLRLIAKNPLKNDKKDACIIAKYLRSNTLPESYLAPPEVRSLRELTRARAFMVRMRTTHKIRIRSILRGQGINLSSKDVSGNKAREWLLKQDISFNHKEEIKKLLKSIAFYDECISEYKKEIKRQGRQYPEVRILKTLPDISDVRALTIMAEIGDFKRFPSPDKLATFAGLVPSSSSSGGKDKLGHITKRGPSALRDVLVGAAQQAKPSWGHLHDFYCRIEKKSGSRTAKVALARKLITISWYLVRKNEPFKARFANEFIGSVSV